MWDIDLCDDGDGNCNALISVSLHPSDRKKMVGEGLMWCDVMWYDGVERNWNTSAEWHCKVCRCMCTISCHVISSHAVSRHLISYHFMPCHLSSFLLWSDGHYPNSQYLFNAFSCSNHTALLLSARWDGEVSKQLKRSWGPIENESRNNLYKR